MLKPFLFLSAVALFAFGALPAATPALGAPPQAGPDSTNPVKPTAASHAQAKSVYARDCALCHGDDGSGKTDLAGSSPSRFQSSAVVSSLPEARNLPSGEKAMALIEQFQVDPGQLPITPLRGPDGEWLRIEIALPGYSLWLRAWRVQIGRAELYLQSMSMTFPDGYVVPVSGPAVLETVQGYALTDPGAARSVGVFALPMGGAGLGALIGHSVGKADSQVTSTLPPGCIAGPPFCTSVTTPVTLRERSGASTR